MKMFSPLAYLANDIGVSTAGQKESNDFSKSLQGRMKQGSVNEALW